MLWNSSTTHLTQEIQLQIRVINHSFTFVNALKFTKNPPQKQEIQLQIRDVIIELNWIEIIIDTSLWYSTATEGCVSNDFFRHLLDDSETPYLTQVPSPSLNAVELIVIHNRPCKHSS